MMFQCDRCFPHFLERFKTDFIQNADLKYKIIVTDKTPEKLIWTTVKL